MQPLPAPDFVQLHWPKLIAALLVWSLAVAAMFWRPSQLWVVYAIATAWTSWNIQAYARGKAFHVSPGLYAEAEDSLSKRRLMLGISCVLHLSFTALAAYNYLYKQA